jgi:pimeloyl-ACP methyl ester carboxylesterase
MKTPILMIHGMCCTGDVWSGFRTFFEQRGTRVYTPTLRPDLRVSLRQRPNRALSALRFADYVADLERETERIESETGRRPAAIGHSMGGLLAQALAERSRVCAAVLISPSAPAGVRDLSTRLFWGGISLANKLKLVPRAISPKRSTVDRVVFNRLPLDAREAALDAMVHESGSAFADMGAWPIDESKIHVPMLTVAASRDRLVPAKLVRLTGQKYAPIGGEFREYEEHAHWLYAEPNWEKPAAEIYDWLQAATSAPAN